MTSSSNAVTLETASGVAVIWGWDGTRGAWSTHRAAICWCWLEVSLPIFVALQLCSLMIWRLAFSCREMQKFKKEAPGWFVCVLPGLESHMLHTKSLPILSRCYIFIPSSQGVNKSYQVLFCLLSEQCASNQNICWSSNPKYLLGPDYMLRLFINICSMTNEVQLSVQGSQGQQG